MHLSEIIAPTGITIRMEMCTELELDFKNWCSIRLYKWTKST